MNTFCYGEIEYYYEYCHPKANKKGEMNRTGHFAWLRSGQRGCLLSRNVVKRTTFHNFYEYFCSGTNFQSVFLLFNMLVKSRCPREDMNHFSWRRCVLLFTIESVVPFFREPKKPALYNPLFFTDAQIAMSRSVRSPVQIVHSK